MTVPEPKEEFVSINHKDILAHTVGTWNLLVCTRQDLFNM
jgi:hypothetical protein